MSLNVYRATRRTFYLERSGEEYRVVKVWEPGATFTEKDMAFAFSRVQSTDPDERIIAEQSFAVSPADASGIVKVSASPEVARGIVESTHRILLGERPAPSTEDGF